MMTHRQIMFTAITSLICVPASAWAEPADMSAQPAVEITKDKDAGRAKRKRRHLRMTLEIAGILAIGNRWYWRDGGRPNIEDWQLSHDWDAVATKLGTTGGWRFDGNPFDINALGHPGFGTLTHVLARRNGYSVLETFLINTAVSGTWEVFLELAEYGSINDLITTSPAGIPLGETAYQILEHPDETQFHLRTGFGRENGTGLARVGVSGDLDRVPTSGSGTVVGARRVGFDVAVTSDAEGLRGLSGNAYAGLLGRYHNSANRSSYVGLTTEFSYRNDKQRDNRPWDVEARTEAGPDVDVHLRRGGTTLSLGTRARGGFSMLKSQAFASWREMNTGDSIRNVMHGKERPYYYALSASVTPWFNLRRGNFEAGASVTGAVFSSIDGYDRDQEMLSSDTHMTDRQSSAQVWLGHRFGRVTTALQAETAKRSGTMGASTGGVRSRRAMLNVAYNL